MEQQGKLVIKGQKTPNDEAKILSAEARRLMKKHRNFEKENKFMIVPIMHGQLEVLRSKYLKNKKRYDEMAVGVIREK